MVGMVDTSSLAGVLRASQRPKPPTPQPTTRSPLDAMGQGYLRNAQSEINRQAGVGKGVVDFLNPLASVTDALVAGRNPSFSDYAMDAGLFAAGLIPFGGPAIRAGGQAAKAGAGLTVTGTGYAGRLSALVRRLNKSEDVGDFITPESMQNMRRPNDAYEGLYRPGAQSFDSKSVPEPASPYTFGLVPTEKVAPLREYDRMAEAAGMGSVGPDNVQKLMDHLASGGKLDDPLSVAYFPQTGAGYLAEGNHRLAMAEQLGLEQLPLRLWRTPGELTTPGVGRNIGPLDTNQLARNQFSDFLESV